jgi:hypothetical protein
VLIVISQSLVAEFGLAPLPIHWITVSGIRSSDEAKIGGITPAVLILIGRCDRSCCIIPRAVWRFGYWISTRRCALSMKQMKATRPRARKTMPATSIGFIVPVRPPSNSCATAWGKRATIPAMMISETPLPIPPRR